MDEEDATMNTIVNFVISWIMNNLISIIVSAVVSVLVSLYVQRWRYYLEVRRDHVKRLKERVIEPLISGVSIFCKENKENVPSVEIRDISSDTFEIVKKFDEELFHDLLENHYPSLKELWLEYCISLRRRRECERKYKERFLSEVVRYINGENLPYIEGYNPDVTDHYLISYLVDKLQSSFERTMIFQEQKEKIIAKEIGSIEISLEGDSNFEVKYHGTPIYITNDKRRAEHAKDIISDLLRWVTNNKNISNSFKEYKASKDRFYKKKEELTNFLKNLYRKEVFNFEKKWKIWVKCPHVKEKLEIS